MRRSISMSCLLAGACCLLNAAPAPRSVLSPLKVIDLGFPPGERSVKHLDILEIAASEGPAGVAVACITEGRRNHYLWYFIKTGYSFVPTKLGDPDTQWIAYARDSARGYGFTLLAPGKLVVENFDPARPAKREAGHVAGTRPFEKEGYQLSRSLVLDADGNVYTAGKDGFLFRYSPKTDKLEQLNARLPAIQGREPWASLDAAALGPDGLIYGGTFDGYVFTFNPKTLEVVNLGKPLRQQRVRGLAFSRGKLYGVGGEEDGLPRAFAYDPKTHGFELGGTLKTTDGKILLDPVGAMVADKDGNIYLGTTGRLGSLYVWEAR